jgi:hypothetical protein
MEGNFLSRYENKINEWEMLKSTDSSNSYIYENMINDYITMCIPYIKRYTCQPDEISTALTNELFGMVTIKGTQKQQIFRDYLSEIEDIHIKTPSSVKQKSKGIPAAINEHTTCSECSSIRVIMDEVSSDLICMDCGLTFFHMMEGTMSYKDEQEHEKIFVYSYKRENHFNEWISQFQAQETTSIPDTVIDQLRSEFKKQKIKNLNDITHAKVRAVLKKLRFNKYYEHVPYIANMLNGIKPPTMSARLEAKLRHMFDEIQEPFNKHCPKDRKNFLSYSYVLYKFCELLEEDDFLVCFPLLKSKEKLYQQDAIWKNICKELRWEFIHTT